MVFPQYLAQTPSELAAHPTAEPAWLSCCFSDTQPNLCSVPENLPAGSILIVDDRTPMQNQDPSQIADSLKQIAMGFSCAGVLLDFQKPGNIRQRLLAETLPTLLSCPAAVSDCYAEGLSCPVFVSPLPLNIPLPRSLAPWKGREIWLDLSPAGERITVSESGSVRQVIPQPDFPASLEAPALHCHYQIDPSENAVCFSFWRTASDWDAFLREAASLGVTKTFGLWQEFQQFPI